MPDFHTLLRTHVQARPHAVAVVTGTREISYAQFDADIDDVTRRLHRQTLPPGGRVALFIASPYLHWLSIIALWRLGVISISAYNLAEPDLVKMLRANVLITDRRGLVADGGTVIAIDDDWLAASPDTLPPVAPRQFYAQHPVRILLSSGTTGLPKKVPYTGAIIAARIKYTLAQYHLGAQHRFMSVAGADTVTGYIDSLATWSVGGSVALFNAQEPIHQLFGRMQPNLVFMSPAQITGIVDTLPPDFPHCGLTLIVGGGRLQQSVVQRARLRLASSIWLLYGSTETGMVAFSNEPDDICPEAVGVVVPNAEVQIVNQVGRTVPHGVIGQVRIRGVCCVEQYLDDPKTSRAFFKEGWFYPGDLGTLSETGQLRIVGRADDIMNFGGVKIAPDAIEELLLACPGVKEAAVFSISSDVGVDELWLAISPSAHYADRELRLRYHARFPDYPMPHLALIKTIPRNSMGKVQSAQLREMVKAQLSRHATAGMANSPDADVALKCS